MIPGAFDLYRFALSLGISFPGILGYFVVCVWLLFLNLMYWFEGVPFQAIGLFAIACGLCVLLVRFHCCLVALCWGFRFYLRWVVLCSL